MRSLWGFGKSNAGEALHSYIATESLWCKENITHTRARRCVLLTLAMISGYANAVATIPPMPPLTASRKALSIFLHDRVGTHAPVERFLHDPHTRTRRSPSQLCGSELYPPVMQASQQPCAAAL